MKGVDLMALQDIYDFAKQNGYKTDSEKGTVSGMVEGVAFLVNLQTDDCIMAINLPEKSFDKLRQQLLSVDERFHSINIVSHERGVLFSGIPISQMTGDSFEQYLHLCATISANVQKTAYSDKHEHYGEPFSAYLKGILGAFLGALVGALPWFIAANFLHFQFGWLGFLVSTASFYGYQKFCGAHSTGFATGCIVIFSLLAMFLTSFIPYSLFVMQSAENFVFPQTLLQNLFEEGGLQYLGRDMIFGIIMAGIGLISIKNRVMTYTHDSQYLRRR